MGDEASITRRKKSGFPNQSAFDDPQVIHSFSKICRALLEMKAFPHGLKIDERSLANVSFQLQTFMESTLGKASLTSARRITKIPQDNFLDYSVDGSLMVILTVALKHQMDAGWKVFSLMASDRFSRGLEIIRDAVVALQEVTKQNPYLPEMQPYQLQ
jgi:SWIRM-associated domain at the N-terminal